jgi:heat shock protein HslJ
VSHQRTLLNKFRKSATIVALVGFAVACLPTEKIAPVGFDDVDPGFQKALSATELEDTKWILTSYGPPEAPVKRLDEPEVTIRFHNTERMHGMAGCNTYAAQFEIEGYQFIPSDIEQTPFGCHTEAEWEQEKEYLAALTSADAIGLVDGLLTISYQGGQLRYEPEPAPPAASLAGTHWRLISFKTADSSQPVIPGATITAAFTGDRIIGTAGCNEYKGAYAIGEQSFTIWEIIKSADPCPGDGVTVQEKRYLDALHSAGSFSLGENSLTISHEEGTLRFGKSVSVDNIVLTEWLASETGDPGHTG